MKKKSNLVPLYVKQQHEKLLLGFSFSLKAVAKNFPLQTWHLGCGLKIGFENERRYLGQDSLKADMKTKITVSEQLHGKAQKGCLKMTSE